VLTSLYARVTLHGDHNFLNVKKNPSLRKFFGIVFKPENTVVLKRSDDLPMRHDSKPPEEK